MKSFVVYHDNCHDGITALWCALQSKEWAGAEPYPAIYTVPPDLEKLRGAQVLLVDFCWKRDAMSDVLDVVTQLTVLDHHATAAADMKGFDKGCSCGSKVVFDMNRSGAGIAWDELVGGKRPALIDYVEDRDLWCFKLPDCREIHAYCDSYELTLEARERLVKMCDDEAFGHHVSGFRTMIEHGATVLRYHQRLAKSVAKNALIELIGDEEVPSVACANMELVSDVGHLLAADAPYAAVWHDRPDGTRYYSLRSREDGGADVGAIAKSMGGGGHVHAAGFTLSTADAKAMTCAQCLSLEKALQNEMERRGRILNAMTGIDGMPLFSPDQEVAIATRLHKAASAGRAALGSMQCLLCGGDRVPGAAHACKSVGQI